jgi:hypothetical protein
MSLDNSSRDASTEIYKRILELVDPKHTDIFFVEIQRALAALDRPPAVNIDQLEGSITYSQRNSLRSRIPLSVHNGQRKLFLNKLQFLTDHLEKRDQDVLVVYAGSAPSEPASLFLKLFPKARWLLVDPAPFRIADHKPTVLIGKGGAHKSTTDAVRAYDRADGGGIYIINEIFTVELAQQIGALVEAGRDVLFISDIRTVVSGKRTSDLDILWNSAQQFIWHRLIRPRASMLKFRHPFHIDESVTSLQQGAWSADIGLAREMGLDLLANYKARQFHYLDGTIKLQPWAPVMSSETRLVVPRDAKIRDYSPSSNYDDRLFWYNTVDRLFCHHANADANIELGFDHCADCSLESVIWREYRRRFGGKSVQQHVLMLCNVLRRPLRTGMHGARSEPLQLRQIANMLHNARSAGLGTLNRGRDGAASASPTSGGDSADSPSSHN